MIRSTFSRSRVLAFSRSRVLAFLSSVALVACGAIAACSGFSSEETANSTDSGADLSDSTASVDGDGSSDGGATTDGSVAQVPLHTFCEAGLNNGSSPHYACLDFEHGDGRQLPWSEKYPGAPKLTTSMDKAASGVRSALVPSNHYRLTIPTGEKNGTWTISSKIYLEGPGTRRAIRLSFQGDNRAVDVALASGGMSGCSQSGTSRVCTLAVATGGWVDVYVRVTSTGSAVDGGFSLDPIVRINDASVPTSAFTLNSLMEVSAGFGDQDFDGGILFDDVIVDVVQ